jgi:glycosyltransferase involved in cell wall biosynthesis
VSGDEAAPLVTIAMPVFNGGATLRVALASLLSQTFTHWELLLIDDGSTDGAVSSLPRDLDARVLIISDGTNRGLAARLNQAIDMAKGRYFARMDHDDVAHPERLEQQVQYLEANPGTDLLGTRCVSVSEDDRVLGAFPFRATHASICASPWLGFYLPHPSWMGRTAWYKRHRYAQPAPFRCEDQELLLRAHAESTYHGLDSALMAYRLRDRMQLGTLLRTRWALGRAQVIYFGSRNDYLAMAAAAVAMVLRMGKDILLPPSMRVRSEVAGSLGEAETLWWRNWLGTMLHAASALGTKPGTGP